MVWILNSPLTDKERKAYDVLEKRFGDTKLAKDTVKIISLVGELKSRKFQGPTEIHQSFFFDSDKKVPIFNKKVSETLYSELKKTGGGTTTSYPFIEYSVEQGLGKIYDVLPTFIAIPIERAYNLLTMPMLTLKERIPLVDLAITAANGAVETGITALGDFAKTIGGPWGTLISIPVVAFAASVAATNALAQRDLGQAVVFMITGLPFVGAIMVKGMDKLEKQVTKLKKYPQLAVYIPFIREHINEERAEKGLPPVEPLDPFKKAQEMLNANPSFQKAKQKLDTVAALQKQADPSSRLVGGKRFSTRKHITNNKWKKTRRNKSAKL
jgi:hypothetical protein